MKKNELLDILELRYTALLRTCEELKSKGNNLNFRLRLQLDRYETMLTEISGFARLVKDLED